MGQSRAAAAAVRCKGFRAGLLAHWSLEDRLGVHFSIFGEASVAAKLMGLELQDEVECLEFANWSKHAAPPGLARPKAMPDAVRADVVEAFHLEFYVGATVNGLLTVESFRWIAP